MTSILQSYKKVLVLDYILSFIHADNTFFHFACMVEFERIWNNFVHKCIVQCIQDTRYYIFQIRAPGGHDTTFIISTYTINKVQYNNYFITINHVCHRLEQSLAEVFTMRFYPTPILLRFMPIRKKMVIRRHWKHC